MKISYNWLRNYLDFDLAPGELSALLTGCGLEVEGMSPYQSVKGGLEGVVVGEVKECVRHPGADKLSLTKVDTGNDRLLSIVCGAPNVAAGQKVLVAAVGTTLYVDDKPFVIKKTKIRGEVSEGMICAEDELGLGTSHEGIMVLPGEYETGKPATDYFPVYEDTIFEIGLTPNRTDAMSHVGVARDIAAVLNTREPGRYRLEMPSLEGFRVDRQSSGTELIVETAELCPRFSGVSLTGVKVGPSPAWLKNALQAIGIRPINNIVDITNYVLMELGQPLHAYDADMIKGNRVVVRTAHKGEKFVTLDEVERELSPNDLMICDEADGMCIAGVFGGLNSGVTTATSRIFLESAHFNAVSVRKTSRYHGLQTDASFRFERGSDPEMTLFALKRAAMLTKELAGAKITSPLIDAYPVKIKGKRVDLSYHHTDRLIGVKIDRDTIKSILTDLGIKILEEKPDGLKLEVPSFKWDVAREADVIEEIIRIYGYDKVSLPSAVKSSLSFVVKPDREQVRNIISDMLSSSGFYEMMNNSLTSVSAGGEKPENSPVVPVDIHNPLSSDLGQLRTSLLPGTLEAISFNRNRKMFDLKIYEFGRVYQKRGDDRSAKVTERFSETEKLAVAVTGNLAPENWKHNPAPADLYDLKAYLFNVFERTGIDGIGISVADFTSSTIDNGLAISAGSLEIGIMGAVSGHQLKKYNIRQPVFYAELDFDLMMQAVAESSISYAEIPRFPEVRRDLALLVDREVEFDKIREVAFRCGDRLLRRVNLFDVYGGENIERGKKSYAVSFILQDNSGTLTDKVIDSTMTKLIKALEKELGASIRGLFSV